jgi:uncharacterized protein
MLQLSEIWIYPVKSLGGISLKTSNTTTRGLEFDRRWLLVDENGVFITQRKYPELAMFKTKITNNFLEVKHYQNAIEIPLNQGINSKKETIEVTVWEDIIDAHIVDDFISTWFTKELGFKVNLVYMPETSIRKVDPNYALNSTDITSFSDGYPFLIIGQNSLNDLNKRLEKKVPMTRFRPNFVFTGGSSYEEDSWHNFTIGDLNFHAVKPCSRCIMTTIDQERGEREGDEPLLTLSKYRKQNSKIYFGQNIIASNFGTINLGDKIQVISKKH